MAAVAYHSNDFEWERVRIAASQELQATQAGAPLVERPEARDSGANAQAWEEFHNRHASARFFKERRYLLAEFPELGGLGPGGGPLTVLEVGCGSGCTALPILRANPSAVVVGVDCSRAAVGHSQAAVEAALGPLEAGRRFQAVVCDAAQAHLGQALAQAGTTSWLHEHARPPAPAASQPGSGAPDAQDEAAGGEEGESLSRQTGEGWPLRGGAAVGGPEVDSPRGSGSVLAEAHLADETGGLPLDGVSQSGAPEGPPAASGDCEDRHSCRRPGGPGRPVVEEASGGEPEHGRGAEQPAGAEGGWPGFDVVTLVFTLSALPPSSMPALLAQVAEVLRPGGLVLFRDYGLYDLAMRRFAPSQQVGPCLYLRGDGTLAYFFSQEALEALFTAQGFTQVESEYCCVELLHRRRQVSMARVWLHAKMLKPFG